MKVNILKMINKGIRLLVVLLVVGLGFGLRARRYREIPIPGQSSDEYSNSWVGISLFELGVPVGISGFPDYRNALERYVNVDHFFQTVATGDPLTINYPWFDHPPLLGVITGGYAYLAGARVFEDAAAFLIRRPIVIIGTLAVLLVIIYGWISVGFAAGIISGLIYATVPLVVLSSRMIQSENAIIPMLLLTMITLEAFLKSGKDKWLILAGICAGIATLFKLSGIVCYLVVMLVLLEAAQRNGRSFIKDYGFFLAFALPISFLYPIFGYVYDGELFKRVIFSNYNRFYGIGPQAIVDLVKYQRLSQGKFLTEGWLVAGWIGVIGLFVNSKKVAGMSKVLLLAIISYLITYVLFGSQPYGWYAFPFWPLLSLVLGVIFYFGIKDVNYSGTMLLLTIIIGGDNVTKIMGLDDFQKWANWWRFGVSGLLVLCGMLVIYQKKAGWWMRGLMLILWLFLLYTNIKYLRGMTVDFWWQNIS
jgi:4-amino-4-deoxy-L-arabinose transferase-like glycosyltransferase